MIADISQVYLQSRFFAELVKTYCPIQKLKDGVIYVKTNNDSNWEATVCKGKESLANHSMRGSWLIKYDIDILPEELYQNTEFAISNLMGNESNIIMPIFLPDRMEQYYFVGYVANVELLDSAASFLLTDAQNLIATCLPYALSVMDECVLKSVLQGVYNERLTDEWAEEVERLGASRCFEPSFRGLITPMPWGVFGEVAAKAAGTIKKGLVSYKKRRELIMKLPLAVKKLRSEDPKLQEEGNIECAQAIAALEEHEMELLLHALLKDSKSKALKKNLEAIADRETLGMQTKYKIVFKPYEKRFKKLGHDYDNYKHCLFIADGDILHPVKMNISSMVIYTMALIEKVTKNKKYAIVNVKANNKAFIEIYKLLFSEFNEATAQKRFEELFMRNKDNPNVPTRKGRLPENYGDIEASLQNAFQNLDEDYSPFLANSTTPLAINAEKIILPLEFRAVKIY